MTPLRHAWQLVKANKGAPGVDGVSFEAIESEIEVDRNLQDRPTRASPVRRVMIPKEDGTMRPLGIPTIRDWVVQMALKLIMEPIFEADFCENSVSTR